MTREQTEHRNREICQYYKSGRTFHETVNRFGFSSAWTRQILQSGGVWRRHEKKRTKFLGVNISEETKRALHNKATQQGVSVSQFVSDHMDKLVK